MFEQRIVSKQSQTERSFEPEPSEWQNRGVGKRRSHCIQWNANAVVRDMMGRKTR